MKKVFFALIGAAMLAAPSIMAEPAAAPDLRDLLGGLGGGTAADSTATGGSGLGGVLGQVLNGGSSSGSSNSGSGLGDLLGGVIGGLMGGQELTAENLAGVYKYSEPAISFVSEDLLQKAGGIAAAAALKSKLQPYYQRAGMEKLQVTLSADQSFQFELGRMKISGTYEKDSTKTDDANAFVFHFQALKSFNVGKIDADLQLINGQLIMTFDASKLITLVNAIAKISGKSSLQAAAKLLGSFDGLRCGFSLKKIGDAPASDSSAAPADSAATDSATPGLGLSGLFNAISNRRK